jgi:hypothetical protein
VTATARIVWIVLAVVFALFVLSGLMTLLIQPG